MIAKQFFSPNKVARSLSHAALRGWLFLLPLSTISCSADEPAPANAALTNPKDGQWKTAYYKRGFVGVYQAAWAGGINSTLRLRVPMIFDGSQVRVTMSSNREEETVLSKISFAEGKDNAGNIEGKSWSLGFDGAPGVAIAAGAPDVVSDAAKVPVKSGIWYLQQSYSSEKYLYAYHKDGFFSSAGDKHDAPAPDGHSDGVWPGNVYRIEVLTKDTRPIILCYGDSITHGYNSTPNAGNAYPEILGNLVKLPVLNFGVNSDLFSYTGGVPSLINSCNGVESVIILMGINDIITGKITKTEEYANLGKSLIESLKNDGKKIYFGTITPAGGFEEFDKDPAKETLRQSINEWIRKDSGADGVIDYDRALADPENPLKMRAEYQSDWLHPNDAGYKKMAETAAAVIKPNA